VLQQRAELPCAAVGRGDRGVVVQDLHFRPPPARSRQRRLY
jgi:hypothetical protein